MATYGKVIIEMDPEVKEALERFTRAAEDFTAAIIAAGEAIKQLRIAAEKSAQQAVAADPASTASKTNDSAGGSTALS